MKSKFQLCSNDICRTLTLDQFHTLAKSAQDISYEVRGEILQQLTKQLKDVQQLPLKYISMLVLYATDPERDLIQKVTKIDYQIFYLLRQNDLYNCASILGVEYLNRVMN